MAFNLSEWALKNRQLVVYAMVVALVAGVLSYSKLGQSEDPPFTFKVMVIQTLWPGATAEEVALQVTERIEKKVMETGEYDRIMSFSRPGESQVLFVARDSLHSSQIPELWYQVRKKVGDIRHTLPAEALGPFFDDEFGTTYGNIYALSGEGFDNALLRRYAERLQLALQRVPDVGKVELLGVQDERVWIELSNTKLAAMRLPLAAVQQALQEQNGISASGFFETADERIQVRVSGRFRQVEDVEDFPLRVDGRSVRLGDVADVRRDFADPPTPRVRFMGEPAIALAVSMKPGGDILRLGKSLNETAERLQQSLPIGMQLRQVSDQPAAVKASVGDFLRVLAEALVIVLLVSFFSLGLRTGLVVALSIPLVLAMTFSLMHGFDIGLHKISLGALVLALGLLVDDAIIAVEMMSVKMEQGWARVKAASFAWTSTAFPMLTGTLITAAGFLPIATAQSGTGEYTRSIFQVVGIALLVSWVAAVVFVPYLGVKLLPDKVSPHGEADPYASPFYQRFRRLLVVCLNYRKTVILVTVLLFLLSLLAFAWVPKQFFPPSARTELLLDLKLSEGASLRATQARVEQLETWLEQRPEISNYVAYVGTGSPRFYLPLDQQLPAASFAQLVIVCHDVEQREQLRLWLEQHLGTILPDVRTRVSRLENGPPVGYPVQFRVSGEHLDLVREQARKVAGVLRDDPRLSNVHLDWEEPSKVVRLRIDQDRARALGISSDEIAKGLQAQLSGIRLGQFREDNQLIDIQLRGTEDQRNDLSRLPGLSLQSASGSLPLAQIAEFDYGFEEGVIWHRNRLPTVTVRADVAGDEQPATLVAQLQPALQGIVEQLPDGYLLEVGGAVEESARGQASVNAGLPLFAVVVLTLLMLQLRSLPLSVLVFLTAPLGLIGVVLFMLVFRQPFGFVAMLGSISLAGMIMRNAVILIDQIEQDRSRGSSRWQAIIDATVRRFRPIVLTALTAVLAMLPLSRSDFFGPMAVAIMGGLIVATLLTLLFLPALYAFCYRVEPDSPTGEPDRA